MLISISRVEPNRKCRWEKMTFQVSDFHSVSVSGPSQSSRALVDHRMSIVVKLEKLKNVGNCAHQRRVTCTELSGPRDSVSRCGLGTCVLQRSGQRKGQLWYITPLQAWESTVAQDKPHTQHAGDFPLPAKNWHQWKCASKISNFEIFI